MKTLIYTFLFILIITSCKEDPKDGLVEKKRVKLYIMAGPGVYEASNPPLIEISGTNLETQSNITSGQIIEVNYPVGEPQTVTLKALKGDPYLYLIVSTSPALRNFSPDNIADKTGKGTLTTTFTPESAGTSMPETSTDPSKVKIGDVYYPVVEIGTQLWIGKDYTSYKHGAIYKSTGDSVLNDGRFYTPDDVSSIVLPDGWRIPSTADIEKLRTFTNYNLKSLMATGMWYIATTNSTKLGLYPTVKSNGGALRSYLMVKNGPDYTCRFIEDQKNSMLSFGTFTGSVQFMEMSLRFVKDK